jgi:MYXO-CTERM domain-containing protein
VDPAGFDEILMVVANLGTETYDPDLSGHPLSSYYYSLQPIIDPAAVTTVVPAAVIRGHQNLHVRVQGENFVYGPDFDIHFSDPMLQVVSIDGFSRTEVLFTLTVPAGAQLGPYDITVVNAGGQEATGEGLITVVDELDTLDPGPKPKGCQTAPTPGPTSLLLLLALFAIILRRRRRS